MLHRLFLQAAAVLLALSGTAEAAFQLVAAPNPVILGSDVTFILSGSYADLLALTIHAEWDSTVLTLLDVDANTVFPGATDPNSSLLVPSAANMADYYFAGSCDDVLVSCPTAASSSPIITLTFQTTNTGIGSVSLGGLDVSGLPTSYTDNSGASFDISALGSVDVVPGISIGEPSSFMLLATAALVAGSRPVMLLRRRRQGVLSERV